MTAPRPSRRLFVAGLVAVAVLLGAVAVLATHRPDRAGLAAGQVAPAVGAAFVVGAPADDLAVGLALTRGKRSAVTAHATVLAAAGPVSGLGVTLSISGRPAEMKACGPGCYRAATRIGSRPTSLTIRLRRPGRKPAFGRFRVPASWPPPRAAPTVRRAAQVFRNLRTLTIVSRLASSPTNSTTTIWRLHAPNRLSYRELDGGAQAVIVGSRRWDRTNPSSGWVESPQSPVSQPAPPWPPPFLAAHLIGSEVVRGRTAWIVSFADPVTPSWFTIAVDKANFRTLWVDMVATAHFMHERYFGFDAPTRVVPPRT